MKEVDIEDITNKVNRIVDTEFEEPSDEHVDDLKPLIMEIINLQRKKGLSTPVSQNEMQKLKRGYNCIKKNSFLMTVFEKLLEKNDSDVAVDDEPYMSNAIRIKRSKSHSGVIVITVMLSPYPKYKNEKGEIVQQSFTCKWNCAYCPNEPNMPRSYLSLEPACLRAITHNFDVCSQIWSRMDSLRRIGHRVITKCEIIIEGGTWSSFPLPYRDEYIRDIYFACNVYWDKFPKREPLSLDVERSINRHAKTVVSGLIIETRPDCINREEVIKLRSYGCTRVQLGIQHIDNDVLEKNNRQCSTEVAKRAIRILKDCGFKIDIHIMPNMYGSTVKKDRDMLIGRLLGLKFPVPRRSDSVSEIFEEYDLVEPDLQADHWKIYPCQIVPWTKIKELYERGEYVPYKEEELIDLLVQTKTLIFPWIRLNRLVRDIPDDYIYSDETGRGNMRDHLVNVMQKDGTFCNCIRCREVKETKWDGKYILIIRKYHASGGDEYFISAESANNRTLYGFVRLRLVEYNFGYFNELISTALIRELHVYGNVMHQNAASTANTASTTTAQHRGLGKLLLKKAEEIAINNKFKKIAVISGEGVREYYAKNGYQEDQGEGHYMMKFL